MKISYIHTLQDYINGQRSIYRKLHYQKRFNLYRLLLGLIVGVCFAGMLFYFDYLIRGACGRRDFVGYFLMAFAGLIIVWLIGWRLYNQAVYKGIFLANGIYLSEFVYEIKEQGLTSSFGGTQHYYPLSVIIGVKETSTSLLIYIDGAVALYIPLRAFAGDAEKQAFIARLMPANAG